MLLLRRSVAALVAALLLVEPSCFAAAAPSSTAPLDNGWPRQVTKNGATLVYYQPQVDEWKNYKELDGRVAFSLTPSNGKAELGVASVTAQTEVNNDTRTVYLRDVKFPSVRFQSSDAQAASAMEGLFRSMAPLDPEPIALDRLMADINRDKAPAAQTVAVNNNPPPIFYSTIPAILLMVQGEPVLNPIWAWLVHHERPGGWVIGGGVIILGATTVRTWLDTRSSTPVLAPDTVTAADR